jgi:hypothetical protein
MSVGLLPSPLMEIRFYWRDAVRFQHNAVSVSVKSLLECGHFQHIHVVAYA